MKKLYLLTDYNDRYLSKVDAKPYRSGNDKELLRNLFQEHGYETTFLNFSDVQYIEDIESQHFLYTSTEDPGYEYKSFIEDVILYLEKRNANVIPGFEFLRANNNKSFLELYRKTFEDVKVNVPKSWSFGSLDELMNSTDKFSYPIVVKKSAGAMSRGVQLARNEQELLKICKKISRTRSFLNDLKDFFRPIKHKDYKRESLYRKKFVLQEFIPNLKNDWKVLVYYDKIFVLERGVKKGDFRASGSKHNYLAGTMTNLPEGFLDYVLEVRKIFDVPNISLDVIYDENEFKIIEFQAVHFGTTTIKLSNKFFQKVNGSWSKQNVNSVIEEYYVESVVKYLKQSY